MSIIKYGNGSIDIIFAMDRQTNTEDIWGSFISMKDREKENRRNNKKEKD